MLGTLNWKDLTLVLRNRIENSGWIILNSWSFGHGIVREERLHREAIAHGLAMKSTSDFSREFSGLGWRIDK